MKNILLFAAFTCITFCVSAQLAGVVISVSDGDTITILDSANNQIRIRLYGIDCPEHNYDLGTSAKKYTASKCYK